MLADAPARSPAPPAWAARLALAGWAALGAAALVDPATPPPAPENAPRQAFSAARALVDLREIAREPHPLGSEANRRVRAYLEQRLRQLEVPFEVQPWQVRFALWPGHPPALAEGVNLLARLPGATGSELRPVVLFVAHYDARPGPRPPAPAAPPRAAGEAAPPLLADIPRNAGGTPGAGDDGAAVAAFLEVLRALRTGPPLANELWFLFTDGEEYGLHGARAFAERPGALERVAAVLNFEGRGNAGPAILFETGRGELALLREYAASAPWPLASSLGPSVYERMPNDSDFSIFRRRGLPGLNMAFIGGGSAYHSPSDTPENLSLRSLQHHGSTALALARRLGSAELARLDAAGDARATFFTLPGNVLIVYAARWDAWVAALAWLALLAVLVQGLRGGALRPRGLVLATLGWPLLVTVLFVALLAGWLACDRAVTWTARLASIQLVATRGNLLSGTLTTLGLAAALLFVLLCVAQRATARTLDAWSAGAGVGWAGLLLASLALARGASHVFAWPLLFAALGLHAALRTRSSARVGASGWLAPWLLPLPALLVLLPMVRLFGQVGSVHPAAGAVLAAVPLALLGGLFLPQLQAMARGSGPVARAAVGLAAGGLLLGSALLQAAGR